MKDVTFHGPGAVLVVDGKRVVRGETVSLSNESADRLDEYDRIDVTVKDEPVSRASASATASVHNEGGDLDGS